MISSHFRFLSDRNIFLVVCEHALLQRNIVHLLRVRVRLPRLWTKNQHSINKSLHGHVNVKESSKHSTSWCVVNRHVSTDFCWGRCAEMSILPLWQHVHLLCNSEMKWNWYGTSGWMLGLMPCWGLEWQWRDRRTPKGCVCCRTIGETSSA